MKLDNDGYPDLPKEPTVTITRVQHEALMAAACVVSKIKKRWGYRQCECDICKADAALRAAGILEGE